MSQHAYWNPWRELWRLQNDMDHLLNWKSQNQVHDEALPIQVWTGEEGAVVTALVPGVQPENLDISILGNILTLRGHRSAPPSETSITLHRRERSVDDFIRSVELPFRVEPQKVVAKYSEGILELLLPRAAEDKPQRIDVKVLS